MASIVNLRAPVSIFLLALAETSAILVSFYVGLYLSWVDFYLSLSQIIEYLPKAILYVFIVVGSMFAFGLYRRDGLFSSSVIIPRILVAFTFALLILGLVFYSFPILVIWRSVLVGAVPAALVWIIIARRLARRPLDSDVLKRRVAVLGTGNQAKRIEALNASPYVSFTCVGYFRVGDEQTAVPSHRILTAATPLYTTLRSLKVDQIVIATTMRRTNLPARDLVDCRLHGIRVSDYQSFFSHESGRIDLDYLSPDWFFVDEGFQAASVHVWLKRTIDLLISGSLLVFTAPLFAIIAMLVWLGDRDPALLFQERVGHRGRKFSLIKFRSMRVDAEADGVPKWSGARDPRLTYIGSFLRRTRLDELPQLWNILKGEMSFVGPRPERPYFVDRLSDLHAYYLDRHAVKPGLTGWAQINFPYGSTDQDARRKLEYDLYYIKYGSVLLDLVIILQTLRIILWPNSVNRHDVTMSLAPEAYKHETRENTT
jgi:sugar transferase (PEP-CTERM system associated)